MNYVYIETEPNHVFTVGFFVGDQWHPESDHPSRELAARRVRYLNGGKCEQCEDRKD